MQWQTTSVEQKVKSIIAEQLGVGEEEIKPESSFIEDLGADSLDIVELVMAMEEEFEVEIPDEEAEHIKTVGGCHQLREHPQEVGPLERRCARVRLPQEVRQWIVEESS